MKRILLLLPLSLVFSGCGQKAPCEPKIEYIEAKYPRLKTLHPITPYVPKYVLKDGYITMLASELNDASITSQRVRKQNIFYTRQINEYNRRFVR